MDEEISLDMFYGTEHYYRTNMYKTIYTDGVDYLTRHGYAWLITDTLSVIEHHRKVRDVAEREGFLIVEFTREGEKGTLEIKSDDGEKIETIYTQRYDYVLAPPVAGGVIKMYWVDWVLLLASEY